MAIIGYTLLVVGLIASFYWQLRFLVVAYNQSLCWFFGCLFVPLVDLLFLCLHFKAAAKPYGLTLLGLLVAFVGGWMAGVAWPG